MEIVEHVGYFKRSWNGNEKLWRVYWPYKFAFAALNAFLTVVDTSAEAPFTQLLWIATLVPSIWWCVSVWRCYENTDTPFLGGLARLVVVLEVIMGVAEFIKAFNAASSGTVV